MPLTTSPSAQSLIDTGRVELSIESMASQSVYLLTAVTSNQTGAAVTKVTKDAVFQAIITTSSGTGSATINIYGSMDGTSFATTALGTITLTTVASGTSEGFTTTAVWPYVRAVLSGISGTGATVNVIMGI